MTGFDSWSSGHSTDFLRVQPGNYAVTVFSRDTFDLTAYSAKEKELIGPDDVRFRNRVDMASLIGCLPSLATALVFLAAIWVPGLYKYALCVLGLAALCWLPGVVLAHTPRYRRIRERLENFNAGLPHCYLLLTPVDRPEGMVGGHVPTVVSEHRDVS
ncbi:MAG: hypothetical protein ACE15C_10900 [Phycisphaerae bacterium]